MPQANTSSTSRRRRPGLGAFALGISFAVLRPPPLVAGTSAPKNEREEFQDTYAAQLKSSPSLFADAPIYHIVPSEDTITFAAAASYRDVIVGPSGYNASKSGSSLPESLTYTGWSGSPYVAFSGKEFGLGLTASVGEEKIDFLRKNVPYDPTTGFGGGGYEESQSNLHYSGAGLFLYYSPLWRELPKQLQITFVGGAESLNCVQQSTGLMYGDGYSVAAQTYRYAVQSYTAGINFGIHLAKRFTFIPWADYAANMVTTPTLADSNANGLPANDPSLTDDVDLYWHSQPSFRYGIDFAVKIANFDIHLGGLLGAVGAINKGNDRIYDNSQAFSLSLSMKGS